MAPVPNGFFNQEQEERSNAMQMVLEIEIYVSRHTPPGFSPAEIMKEIAQVMAERWLKE